MTKANAKQRSGRAGRVQAGKCYRLYPESLHDRLPDFLAPEMQRTPLESVCLQIKSIGAPRLLTLRRGRTHASTKARELPVTPNSDGHASRAVPPFKRHSTAPPRAGLGSLEPFLAKAMDPPEAATVAQAVQHLRDVDALDAREELTPLGSHLAQLPVDAAVGKLLIMGAVLDCLDPILGIAASLSYRSPFVVPLDKRGEADAAKQRFAEPFQSDHWAVLCAQREYARCRGAGGGEWRFCGENFLQRNTLELIRGLRDQLAGVRRSARLRAAEKKRHSCAACTLARAPCCSQSVPCH